MSLAHYCSPDEVRAVLGVSDEELSDETLNLPLYTLGLQDALTRVSQGLPDAFSAVMGVAETLRTREQTSLYNNVRLYSVYAVAKQAGIALAMLGPKTLSDEKSSFSRFAGEPYKDVLDRIDAELGRLSNQVKQALADLGEAAFEKAYAPRFVISKRGYDPVTGEGLRS